MSLVGFSVYIIESLPLERVSSRHLFSFPVHCGKWRVLDSDPIPREHGDW